MNHLNRITHHVFDLLAAQRRRASQRRNEQRAIAELRAYSDAQLQDLGLNRSTLAQAIRHGRTGVDV